MISQLSLVPLIIIAFIGVGLFLVLISFTLPNSFYANQAKREKMLKDQIKETEKAEEDDAVTDADTGDSVEGVIDETSSGSV